MQSLQTKLYHYRAVYPFAWAPGYRGDRGCGRIRLLGVSVFGGSAERRPRNRRLCPRRWRPRGPRRLEWIDPSPAREVAPVSPSLQWETDAYPQGEEGTRGGTHTFPSVAENTM